MIDDRIKFIDGALGRLLQLAGELLGIDGRHLAAGGWSGEEPSIPGGADVGFLDELEIRIVRMLF
ncbi:MAG: hypothetical protein ACE5R6_11090 [Candidatus Heimdallarchaeota archaeon]